MNYILLIIGLILGLQASAQKVEPTAYDYSIGLQMGVYQGWVFEYEDFVPSPSLQLVAHTRFLDIGIIGGLRHRAYGSEWPGPQGQDLADNLVMAKERGTNW